MTDASETFPPRPPAWQAGGDGASGSDILGRLARYRDPTDDFWSDAIRLLGSRDRVLRPGNASPLWDVCLGGSFLEAAQNLSVIRDIIGGESMVAALPRDARRPAAWLLLASALVSARLGRVRRALELTSVLGRIGTRDSELNAWVWNVRSLSYGKLEMLPRYQLATRIAVSRALEAGLPWLADTIRLRHLHKESWAASERGRPLDNVRLEVQLNDDSLLRSDLTPAEHSHILGQRAAYMALQLTWQPTSWAEAEDLITVAEGHFVRLGDASELARMRSERGRLYLLSGNSTRAVRTLQSGLARRLDGGEYPRARYDFLWLGQALENAGLFIESETANILVLAIHEEIYGVNAVDKGVVREARRRLRSGSRVVRQSARLRRLDLEHVVQITNAATGLGEERIIRTLDINRVRGMIVRLSRN